MIDTWDPGQYLTYADERARPFVDLLARVEHADPRLVVDLGAGPGNLTVSLAARWPGAQVVGVDDSPSMVAAARRDHGGPVRFEQADLRDWTPPAPVDVLVSNATLHWVPEHLRLLPTLLGSLAPGGVLAVQVPGDFEAPLHVIRRELAATAPYAAHLTDLPNPRSHNPQDYLHALAPIAETVDAWETTYLHVLSGPDPVFEWTTGTGARPTLAALPPDLRESFAAQFAQRLRAAYPPESYGTVLPFRRVFVVARKAPAKM
ncbi:MAG: methyltransferase domain-containing protein [Dermatophilaceae bacterium]